MGACESRSTVTYTITSSRAYQKLVVHSLDDYLLRLVLADVESQLQELAVALVLDEWGAEPVKPSPHLALLLRTPLR